MTTKTYGIIQAIGGALLFIVLVIQLFLFFYVSALMSPIEQKQAVLENRLVVIRRDGINLQPSRSYPDQ